MLKYTRNAHPLRIYRLFEIPRSPSRQSNRASFLVKRNITNYSPNNGRLLVHNYSYRYNNYHNVLAVVNFPPTPSFLGCCGAHSLSGGGGHQGVITSSSSSFPRRNNTLKRSLALHDLYPRSLHSSPSREGEPPSKPSSKVEETAKVLTEEFKGKQDGTLVPGPKRPLYKRIQDEILHYYHGFKLLFIDMNITRKLIWKILNGKTLSRREHKQFIRTTSDVFRLVPFSVFIIVPFMELLLPVFLKLFPGMLPSTFQTKSDRETKMKGELKVKLEMAKFLQETLDEMAPQANGRSSQTAKEFAEFIQKIRTSGSEVSNTDIMKFSKLFEDEITLDSLSRPQLLALCRVLEIPAYGTIPMLRFQLRMRLRNLAADDQMIESEGADALNFQELQTACKARGMRAVGVTEERLRRQLDQWLQLSLHEKVPPSLLLLSRAMYLPDHLPASAQLHATLSALPEGAALQTKAAIGEREGKVDNKTRIELIKEEERLIKEEQQEAKKLKTEEKEKEIEKARELKEKEKKEKEEREKLAAPEVLAPLEGEIVGASSVPKDELEPRTIHEPVPLVSELGPELPHHPADSPLGVIGVINNILSRRHIPPLAVLEDKLTAKDFEAIEGAIDQLSCNRQEMLLEKEELQDLKEEMADYTEDLKLLENVVKQSGTKKLKVNKGAKRLFNKLNSMISEMERTVETENKPKPDGKIENSVATEELISVMRQIQTVEGDPDKVDRIARVLAKLDDNKDGHIEIDDLVKVIEIVGRENVNMTSKQLEEIVSILAKEETLEGKKPVPPNQG